MRGFCLWIGLGAFLVAEPGACLAQTRPPSPDPPHRAGTSVAAVPVTSMGVAGPASLGLSTSSTAGIAIARRLPASNPPWTRFLASTAGDNAEGSARGTGTPVYKKTWFIAAAIGVVAVAVLLLASGGGDDGEEPGPQPESLPGFPPPPTLPASVGSGGSVR